MADQPQVSKLIDGKLPAGQVCPYKENCIIAKEERCFHKGENHTVNFSCGAARWLEITDKK